MSYRWTHVTVKHIRLGISYMMTSCVVLVKCNHIFFKVHSEIFLGFSLISGICEEDATNYAVVSLDYLLLFFFLSATFCLL